MIILIKRYTVKIKVIKQKVLPTKLSKLLALRNFI